MASSTPTASRFAALVTGWLPKQRWFAAKDGGDLELMACCGPRLCDPSGAVVIQVHLVTTTSADGSVATYQVPLTYRPEPEPTLAHALVGVLEEPGEGQRWVYDGPHDPVFVAAWMHLIAASAEAVSDEADDPSWIRGMRLGGASPPTGQGHVLHGEQSNTSIIVSGPDDPDPVIVKLFRVMQPGRNPDIVVPAALTIAGCARVPRLVGWVEAGWQTVDDTVVSGHLTSVAEFLPGSEDAWRIACRAVAADEAFELEATQLGQATAEVHAVLAATLPTRPATSEVLQAMGDHLAARLDWAVGAVPALARYAEAARAALAAVRMVSAAPDLQCVHGDLHLGQVLHTAARGWVLLDFEGEPLRPLAERSEPDLALRDVAGMLRSFDYAARHCVLGLPDDDPSAVRAATWVADCRRAFLAGYAEVAGRDPQADQVLLRALELDKALYEVVYESRHRPDWVEVPLRAVDRLLAG